MIPPRVILAAVTFSDASRVALVLAARLARHCGAELHVVHAEDPLLNQAADRAGFDLAWETRLALRRLIRDAWPAARCSPQAHVVGGSPVRAILDTAHQHGADLIVISRCGRSTVERLVFGSTTEALLRQADVSVLVTPPDWLPPDPDAADLSGAGPLLAVAERSFDGSGAAAAAASRLASALGTSVEVVHDVSGVAVVPDGSRASMLVLDRSTRDAKGAARRVLAYRALSATIPILWQAVESVLG